MKTPSPCLTRTDWILVCVVLGLVILYALLPAFGRQHDTSLLAQFWKDYYLYSRLSTILWIPATIALCVRHRKQLAQAPCQPSNLGRLLVLLALGLFYAGVIERSRSICFNSLLLVLWGSLIYVRGWRLAWLVTPMLLIGLLAMEWRHETMIDRAMDHLFHPITHLITGSLTSPWMDISYCGGLGGLCYISVAGPLLLIACWASPLSPLRAIIYLLVGLVLSVFADVLVFLLLEICFPAVSIETAFSMERLLPKISTAVLLLMVIAIVLVERRLRRAKIRDSHEGGARL